VSTESAIAAGVRLVRVGVDAAEGKIDPEAIAAAAVAVALEFVPVEELRQHLDRAAIARAELAADVIEDVRFPR
jgi:hypothetical protein